MIRFLAVLFVVLVCSQLVFSQKVKWYTFEEAIALNEKEPRNIMIDVYTDWCGWCKVMDKQTFSVPSIIETLNRDYYPVKFDAENHDTIVFQGHTFVNPGEGNRPSHQLAVALLQGKMSYPNIVFLNKNTKMLGALPGFKKPEEMTPILQYISQELYKKEVDLGKYIEENKIKK